MQNEILALFDAFRADYARWQNPGIAESAVKSEIRQTMMEEYNNGLSVEEGQKFIKLISRKGSSRGVLGFIVKEDGKAKLKNGTVLKRGDLLKANSWKAPALNFTRGNIFNLDASTIQWTGIS